MTDINRLISISSLEGKSFSLVTNYIIILFIIIQIHLSAIRKTVVAGSIVLK